MSASVKIMLSYDYCHFEVCKSSDEPMTDKQINEMRKDVQRLADEAVRQYKLAKHNESEREKSKYEEEKFEAQIKRIKEKPEGERTINEVAQLKQWEDEQWRKGYFSRYDYDYEDDEQTYDWEEEYEEEER